MIFQVCIDFLAKYTRISRFLLNDLYIKLRVQLVNYLNRRLSAHKLSPGFRKDCDSMHL